MAKKFKTMDGNAAAAYVSYAFTDVAAISPSLRPPRWLRSWMTWQRMEKRTCSVRKSAS